MYAMGAEHVELPNPQPGHWRILSASAAEAGTAEGQGVVALEERGTGLRLPTALAGHGMVMQPGMFEGGQTSLWLYPHSAYIMADMVPRDPSRACSFCAAVGVRLRKCGGCRAARYW